MFTGKVNSNQGTSTGTRTGQTGYSSNKYQIYRAGTAQGAVIKSAIGTA